MSLIMQLDMSDIMRAKFEGERHPADDVTVHYKESERERERERENLPRS